MSFQNTLAACWEALRQPLEDKKIDISRANGRITYPADFMLVATMNPCPCGYYGDKAKECSCTNNQITSYQKRISGPLMDRIDIVVNVSRVPNNELLEQSMLNNNQHLTAIESINRGINMQNLRYGSCSKYNSSLTSSEVKTYAQLDSETKKLLNQAADKLAISSRGYFKIIKIARTIADIAGEQNISVAHISEALQYRIQ